MSLVIATFNILNPYHAVKWSVPIGLSPTGRKLDSEELKNRAKQGDWRLFSNWLERKKLVAQSIMAADIVCLQEVSEETVADLRELGVNIPIVALHSPGGEGETHGNAIACQSDSVKFVEGSSVKFRTGDHYRSAAVGRFAVGKSTICVASVHLKGFPPRADYEGPIEVVKREGYDELKCYVDAVEQEGSDVLVVGGDFNEDWRDLTPPLRRGLLKERGFQSDKSTNETELETGRRLDWIYVKGGGKVEHVDFEKQFKASSDHRMTGIRLKLTI